MVRVMARLRKRSLSDHSSSRLGILPAQLGDQVQSLGDQQLLGQWLREIAFVAKKLAHQAFRELRNRMPIIDIARGQAKGQDLTLNARDQVQLEAVEPAHRGLAPSSTLVKDAIACECERYGRRQAGWNR
jgi:hypothetical protein